MRRTLLLAVCAALVGGLAIATAGLAGDRSPDRPARADRPATASGPFAAAERRAARDGDRRHRARRHPGGMHGRMLASLAGRLDVTPARLRRALRAVRRDVRDELVDPRTATPEQRVAMKERLAGALASELGVAPERVVTAVRAELADKLDLAVRFGAVTERGRELALGCFDDPAACDLAALKAEVRFRHHRRGGR